MRTGTPTAVTDPAVLGHRMLVVFSDATAATPMVEAAVRLAAGGPGAIGGVFLEDADLLRLAELPFAAEFGITEPGVIGPGTIVPGSTVPGLTAGPRRLQRDTLERDWLVHAEKARALLARLAEPDGLPWSFDVVRGQLAHLVQQASLEVELLWLRRAPLAESYPVTGAGLPVITLFDATAADQRALRSAEDLAWTLDADLLVLLPGAPLERRTAREAAASVLRRFDARRVHFGALTDAAADTLAAGVRRLGGGYLVLARERLGNARALERLARQRGALLLVR